MQMDKTAREEGSSVKEQYRHRACGAYRNITDLRKQKAISCTLCVFLKNNEVVDATENEK